MLFIGFIIVLLLLSPAFTEVEITMKNGKTFTWVSYTEENGHYCTIKEFGSFCVSKSNVASLREFNNIPEGAIVIERPEPTPDKVMLNNERIAADKEAEGKAERKREKQENQRKRCESISRSIESASSLQEDGMGLKLSRLRGLEKDYYRSNCDLIK